VSRENPLKRRAECRSALLGLPKDAVDLGDLVQQLLADSDVGRLLGPPAVLVAVQNKV